MKTSNPQGANGNGEGESEISSITGIPALGIDVNVAVVQNGGNVLVHQAIEQHKHTHPCNPFQAWIKWESDGWRELITRSSIIGVAKRTGRQL